MLTLTIIILILLIIFLKMKEREKFDLAVECDNCNYKSYHQCRNCPNCGVCTNQLGDSICLEGDENGPKNPDDIKKHNCYTWQYGNIYPQYRVPYYNDLLLGVSNDARFYPFMKTLDDRYKIKKYFTDQYDEMNKTYTRLDISNRIKQINFGIDQINSEINQINEVAANVNNIVKSIRK